jgi:hypothetical protein
VIFMMQMVKVTWEAATSSGNEVPMLPKTYESVGFIVRENDKILVLSQSVEYTQSGITVDKTLSLPKIAITRVIPLEIIIPEPQKQAATDPTESTQSESQENATDETPDAA